MTAFFTGDCHKIHMATCTHVVYTIFMRLLSICFTQEERSKVDDLRGTPMAVGTLEEIIDDNHAIVSTSVGSEYYVNMLSFVDKDLIEPGCTVLLNNKVRGIYCCCHFLYIFHLHTRHV